MRILDFTVSRQNIECDPACDFTGIASGSRGYLYARFRFSGEWVGYKRIALFSCRGRTVPVPLTDSICKIPAEALVGSTVKVAVIGKRGDSVITTNDTCFQQISGGMKYGNH